MKLKDCFWKCEIEARLAIEGSSKLESNRSYLLKTTLEKNILLKLSNLIKKIELY